MVGFNVHMASSPNTVQLPATSRWPSISIRDIRPPRCGYASSADQLGAICH